MKKIKKIGLICSPDHYILPPLSDTLKDYPTFLLTDRLTTPAFPQKVYHVDTRAKGLFSLIARFFKIFCILRKERPCILFAAGSEIAVPAFYFGKFFFRTKLAYHECPTRIDRPSLTGRLVYSITDLFFVEQEPFLEWYGPKARCFGMPSFLWEISDLESTLKESDFKKANSFFPHPVQASLKDIKGLEFPGFKEPVVSIIIPVHNKWEYTYHCLRSILENTDIDLPYEVIISDDASTDQTSEMLRKVKGVRVIMNREPLRFLRNCNHAAAYAKGKYLLFLNNDTYVTKGWLRSLAEPVENDPKVGMVGGKLIFPDGTLQEAGGIVWNDPDHTAWNYGRNDDPDKPEYSYLKEADYLSGACLLIRKEIFEELKGFDERYTFAYYEDADLAFSLRKMGFKVVFQPQCKIIHFEGASHGKELSDEGKSYQLVNQKRFYEKWRETLEAEHFRTGENLFLARDRSQKKKVMLYVDHYIPTYDKDAGSHITYEYLKVFLGMNFKIIFWPNNLHKNEPYASELQQMGIEVVYGLHSFSHSMQTYGQYIDIAVLSRPNVSTYYIDILKKYSNAKVVYLPIDLHFMRIQREAQVKGHPELSKEADVWRAREFDLMRKSDMTWVFSTVEKAVLEKEIPEVKAEVSPWIQALHTVDKNFKEKRGLIFIAGFAHPPNEDGILWFAKEVFPSVTESIPDIKLTILGSSPTEKVRTLNSDHIQVIGFVKDPSSYFSDARVFISPLRFGAGLKGKILNAMSYGLPVVSSSIGTEGIGLEDERNVLVADHAEGFAERVVRLHQDEELWRMLSENGLAFLRAKFSAEHGRKRFGEIFSGLEGKGENV